jgi:ribosomal-protein-alanine N-acetyltransferase
MADALQVHVPAEWPPEHWDQDAIQYLLRKMDADPAARGWARYIVLNPVDPSARILIGSCGATGPITPGPNAAPNEEPEIGYSILPSFQRQGYCTEAVLALCAWIFAHPGTASICAQTLPHLQPSIRVLEKCGFHFAGPGKEEGAILYRKPW